MSRTQAVFGSALFFVIAPFALAGVAPWLITHWRVGPAYPGVEIVRVIGAVLTLAGAVIVIDSFARFALQGRGTPAPVAPPSSLVVAGFYRHVRNPMYVGVISAILGQALAFGDVRLVVYAALFWLATHIFVAYFEEPRLAHEFAAAYEAYRANVPRWIPRLTPWRPGS
jgi:protein-S-isoprenylcysteine O-methyltransferase Ste14